MGTILVPHSAHYRGMSPPVQAAAAGGLPVIALLPESHCWREPTAAIR